MSLISPPANRQESPPTIVDRIVYVGGKRAYGSLSTPLDSNEHRLQIQILFESLKSAKSFLDIGCGFGNMLSLAKEINPEIEVVGIEVQSKPAKVASAYGRVIKANALNFTGYSKFDVLYMYRPFVEYRDQLELEDLVIRSMRPGAILFSLLPNHRCLCRTYQRGIYTKEQEDEHSL